MYKIRKKETFLPLRFTFMSNIKQNTVNYLNVIYVTTMNTLLILKLSVVKINPIECTNHFSLYT